MKKILLGTIVSSLCISMFCQTDEYDTLSAEEEYYPAEEEYYYSDDVELSDEPAAYVPDGAVTCDSIRFLSGINDFSLAEAYPWISGDGLRLYYTKSDTILFDRIFFAERENINSPFLNSRLLIDSESYSGWLARDELDIFYITRDGDDVISNTLYHANRKSLEEKFGKATPVKLNGDISGYICGPSFTPDGNQLFLYNDNDLDEFQGIIILNKTADDEFELVDTLDIPSGYVPSPGQVSSDGLKYYLSLVDTNTELLYYYSRNSLSEQFGNLLRMENERINDAQYQNCQPAVSDAGECMVYTRNTEDSWESNDLILVYNIEITDRFGSTESTNE